MAGFDLQGREDLLRFITCGGVDDGKTTLIGRLLDDSQPVPEDQMAAPAAEREQGVAYRHFATPRRRFVVADTPGHEQYTRNVVTGSSTAEVAVVLVDARKGVLTQTRRHSYIAALMGVRHLVLAVNKMDLVGWDEATFRRIAADYTGFARALGVAHVTCIPISALNGDNVTVAGGAMPWYAGPPLLSLLEGVDIGQAPPAASRGDVLAEGTPGTADQFAAHVVWMDDHHLLPGRSYLFRIGTATVAGQITEIKYKVNVDTLEHVAAKVLEPDEIGFCNMALEAAVAFEAYADNRARGGFIIVDRFTDAPVGAGTISFALRRATNISWHRLTVDKAARARLKGQKPAVLWFTGLSGSGKSTVANLVEQKLHAMGRHTYVLDGDNVRHGLNKDLGFTEADRVENIRRVAEVAKLFADAGILVLVAFISPFRAERRMARDLMEKGEFLEVFVDTPFAECERRDPKGLYRKARAGLVKNFTGLDSPYEPPQDPELLLDGAGHPPERLADQVIEALRARGLI